MRVLTHARPRRRHAQLRSSVRVLRTSARRARPHHTSDDRMSLEPRFRRARPSISSGNGDSLNGYAHSTVGSKPDGAPE